MLTKIVGPTVVATASATTQTFSVSTFQTGDLYGNGPGQQLNVLKVRISSTQPIFLGLGQPATSTSSLMLPQNTAEHFKLDSTSTVSILQAASGGLVTITPVA